MRIIRWCKITCKRSFFKTFTPRMARASENVVQGTNLWCHRELRSQSQGVMPLASHCSKRMLRWTPWHSSQDCGSTGLLMGTLEHTHPTTAKIWLHHRHLWGYTTEVALQWIRAAKCPESSAKRPGACVVGETSIQVRWVLLQHSRPCRKQCAWLRLVLYTELWSNNRCVTTALDLKWKY